MSPRERILSIRLLEKIRREPELAGKAGLEAGGGLLPRKTENCSGADEETGGTAMGRKEPIC